MRNWAGNVMGGGKLSSRSASVAGRCGLILCSFCCKSELYPAIQPFLNRSITALEIDQMKVAVANVYRQTGWIVEVYLPQQTLDHLEYW